MMKWMRKKISISLGTVLLFLLCIMGMAVFAVCNRGLLVAVIDKCEYILSGSSEDNTEKQEVYSKESSFDMEGYVPFSYGEDEWFVNIKSIAHGGGQIDGNIYTNSLEAVENSYNSGFRAVEVDLRVTQDGKIVLRHSWNDDMYDEFSADQIPTKDEFLNTLIKYIYTPLSLEAFVEVLENYQDLIAVMHLQDYDDERYQILISGIKDCFTEHEEVLNRVWFMNQRVDGISLEQYGEHMQQMSQAVNANWIHVAFENEDLKYCLQNKIKVVMINAKSNIDIALFRKYNVAVFYYYTDDIKECVDKIKEGCNGIFSNFLNEETVLKSMEGRR